MSVIYGKVHYTTAEAGIHVRRLDPHHGEMGVEGGGGSDEAGLECSMCIEESMRERESQRLQYARVCSVALCTAELLGTLN